MAGRPRPDVDRAIKVWWNRFKGLDLNLLVAQIIQTGKTDELGSLTEALERFRFALGRGDEMLAEQEQLQQQIETGCKRQRDLDNAKAGDLCHFVELVQSRFNGLAAGDLTVRMNECVAPEFDPIRQSFNVSVSALEETVSNGVRAVYTIRSGLGEISAASNDLARRTEQQAASLEETVAALGEVTRGVNETADGASNAQKTVNIARTNAEKAGEVVARAIAAMTEIQDSSSKIGNIISVIDEIAFQTSLTRITWVVIFRYKMPRRGTPRPCHCEVGAELAMAALMAG